jgi:arylmalonate decarboxylase
MKPSAVSRIGLIVPPPGDRVPADAALLYGHQVDFVARSLGITGVSPEGFAPVIDQVVERALELRRQGAEAISLMGTSLSFYRGAEWTDRLRAQMTEATGVPCTTMSHAIVAALRALDVRRVAVATAYVDALNERLRDYLNGQGFEVTALEGLSMTHAADIEGVGPSALIGLAERVFASDESADGIFISCGGLQTHEVIEPLERRLGVPVAASSPAGFWDVMRLAGRDPFAAGFGRLFRGG